MNAGSLNLTHMGMAQSFFKREAFKKAQKLEILEKLEDKSTREAERVLLTISPKAIPDERVRPITPERTEYRFSAGPELSKKIGELKNHFSHTNPFMSLEELFEKLCDMGLEKIAMPRKSRSRPLQTNGPYEVGADISDPEDTTTDPNTLPHADINSETNSDANSMKRFFFVVTAAIFCSVSVLADTCNYESGRNRMTGNVLVRADKNGTDEDWGQMEIPPDLLPLAEGQKSKWSIPGNGSFELQYKNGVLKHRLDTIYGEHFRTSVETDAHLRTFRNFTQKVRVSLFPKTVVDCR